MAEYFSSWYLASSKNGFQLVKPWYLTILVYLKKKFKHAKHLTLKYKLTRTNEAVFREWLPLTTCFVLLVSKLTLYKKTVTKNYYKTQEL